MSQVEKIKFSKLANFFDKQRLALEATKLYDYVLYAGAAGSGKSYFLRWICLYWLLKWYGEKDIKGIQVGLFCETYPALHDRHLKFVKQEFPSWLGDYYEQKHEFVLKPQYGGGIIAFRNLDDPEKYRSSEFALIAVDELTRNPIATFDLLRTRLRRPGIDRPKFIAATNPFGEYIQWVRQLWVEKNFPSELDEIKNQFYLIEAKGYDNPHLPEEYYKSLGSLPEAERKAFLEGNWYAFEAKIDEKGYIPLITSQELDASLIEIEERLWSFKPLVLGVDVGAGGDKSVIVLRNQLGARILFAESLKDTMSLVGIVVKFLIQYQASLIFLDKTGVGQGVADRLSELGFGLIVREIAFGEKPIDKNKFKNKKAELFWRLKEWIIKGGKLLKDDRWSELLLIKYKISSDRVIEIQPKGELLKAGYNSPDVADALALTFAEDLDVLKRFTLQEEWIQNL